MSSAGHVLDMIKRSRYNDSIRRKRMERMRDIKDAYQEEIRKTHHIDFRKKDISQEELEKIKAKIRKKTIQKQRKAWLYSGIGTIVTVIVLAALVSMIVIVC
ncbi:hypothetical protein [Labilibacter marinus]|uniref:hypothetical protein n=1 Tax=Labilibacter marinus TaxID=1477105 RepID=UPI000831D37F|nr:hypothetical protein [Labilibacter marinus]